MQQEQQLLSFQSLIMFIIKMETQTLERKIILVLIMHTKALLDLV